MTKPLANANGIDAIETRVSGVNILQLAIGALLMLASGVGYELHPSVFAIPAMMGGVLLTAGAKAFIPSEDRKYWRSVEPD